MNLSESLHTLRKRWVLTLVLLVLVGVGAVGAAIKLPRTYDSTSQVALLASKTDSKMLYDGNPYLAFDDSLNVAADVVGRRMMDPRVVSTLAAEGYTGSYEVEDAPNSPGPVLIITVTDKNPTEAESTVRGVTDAVATQLSSLQSGVSQQDRITDMVLSISVNPTLSLSKMARPLAAVLVLGLVLVISIPLIVEGMSVRRRARGKSSQTPGPGPGDGTDVPSASERSSASSSYYEVGPKGSK